MFVTLSVEAWGEKLSWRSLGMCRIWAGELHPCFNQDISTCFPCLTRWKSLLGDCWSGGQSPSLEPQKSGCCPQAAAASSLRLHCLSSVDSRSLLSSVGTEPNESPLCAKSLRIPTWPTQALPPGSAGKVRLAFCPEGPSPSAQAWLLQGVLSHLLCLHCRWHPILRWRRQAKVMEWGASGPAAGEAPVLLSSTSLRRACQGLHL